MAHTIYPQTVGGADAITILPGTHCHDLGGLQPLIVIHGHGATSASVFQQGGAMFMNLLSALADRCGFAVIGIYTGPAWLNQAGIDLIESLLSAAYGVGAVGKACVLGFSMGGGHALRFLQEHKAQVACVRAYSPVTDLMGLYNAPPDPSWPAEMDGQYGGNTAANGAPRSPINNAAAFVGGQPVLISHPTDDAVVPYAHSTAFLAAVNDPAVKLRATNELGGHAVHDTTDALVSWFQTYRAA